MININDFQFQKITRDNGGIQRMGEQKHQAKELKDGQNW